MTMMNKLGLVILLFVLTAVSVPAQDSKSKAELTALLNEFLAGAGRNDAAVHDKFWAEDLIYTRSAGSRINKVELMAGVRSAPAHKPDDPVTAYSADDVQIQVYGSTAVVAFRLIGTTTGTDGTVEVSNYLNTGTFLRRKGRWQAVAWQATIIPKPASVEDSAPRKGVARPSDRPARSAGRTYLKGPQGGCYYIAESGRKTYVKKELCN